MMLLGYNLTESVRDDGSIYLTCAALPGFHFILSKEPGDFHALKTALSEFIVLYNKAQTTGATMTDEPSKPVRPTFMERASSLARDAGGLAADLASHAADSVMGVMAPSVWRLVDKDKGLPPINHYVLIRLAVSSVLPYGYDIKPACVGDDGQWRDRCGVVITDSVMEWTEIPE